ncbi:MAG: hypothetical protein IJV88_02055 [Ruminococcus sp.]|nr:hypothetical protein [Ruminococcus sp.]
MRSGEILKSASAQPLQEGELELINSYTRRPFTEDEVYVFSVVLCDNDVDRDYERFTVEALFELEKLFVGKTGIFDHNPKAQNQTARIFRCFVEAVQGRKTLTGDDYFRLVARAYMPKGSATEDMILQIESGICKEVSVGCAADRIVCSVCGSDKGTLCGHVKGQVYGSKLCYYELSHISDAYEWSFVAVPAQREAGVIKGFLTDGRKDYSDMNEIIKNLTAGDAVTLCQSDARKLAEYITGLEQSASQGEEYRQELMAQVLRMSATVQPDVSRKTMESALSGLSIGQLREFAKAFEDKTKKAFLPSPQLRSEVGSAHADNKEFRI